MSTAIQNIERAKGAAAELRWLLAEVRAINFLYGGKDLVLNILIDKLVERQKAAAASK